MSSDQVAYDEAYDLPRWQSQDTHSSRSLQYYPGHDPVPAPAPPQAVVVSGSSSSRRIAHLVDDGVPLGRSASLNAAVRSTQQQQQQQQQQQGDQAMSFYPSSVAYHSTPDHTTSATHGHSHSHGHGAHDYSAPRRANTNVDPNRQRKQQGSSSSAARNSASYVPSVQLYPDPYQPQPPPPASPGGATGGAGSYYAQQQQQGQGQQSSGAPSGYAADNVAVNYSAHLVPGSAGGAGSGSSGGGGGGRGALSSPGTPHSYSASPLSQQQQQGQGQGGYYGNPDQQTPMDVQPSQQLASQQKPVGLKRVRDARDLRPYVNPQPRGRSLDPSGIYLSPLRSLTTHLTQTYNLCNPGFRYEVVNNPRRVLTKPSKPSHNEGYDNEDYDYILYVNDLLGTEEGHKYLILDVLGQGTFGQVVKCQNIKTHEIVAVKVVKNKPAYFNQSMMEVTILELLNRQCDPHDEHHILRLRDSFIHRNHLCLVFELLSSNLYELIKQNSFGGLSTQLVKVFMTQLLDALTILKDARLIHCDLKPENILLKSLQSPQIKIIDFGSACHERQTVYTYIQSRFYRSPEVLLGIPYTAAIDMWSLGCIAVELFLGLPLFPGTSEYNQVTRIVEMLGMPPTAMLDAGKQTTQFFDTFTDQYGQKTYRLKSLETYSREHNTQEQPGKKYFNHNTLPEIIRAAPMPATRVKPHELEKEINNRTAFIDFCQGLLNLDPTQRWTPQQAKLHPFISGSGSLGGSSHSSSPRPPASSAPAADPKRPYGGLVPMQPKGTRAYQDAASYNQQLAQHQAYTAQAQQAANQANNTFRNPYINAPSQTSGSNGSSSAYGSSSGASGSYSSSGAGSGSYSGSSSSGAYASGSSGSYSGGSSTVYGGTTGNYSGGSSTAYGSGAYGSSSTAYNGSSSRDDVQNAGYGSSSGQYGSSSGGSSSQPLQHQSSHGNLGLNTQISHYPAGVTSAGGVPPNSNASAGQLNPPSSAYYPRGRSNTITHDVVPPALARIANMSMDVPGIGRNALTPVMKRDDPMREWERRQNAGQQVGHVTYPQLEILQQQAEMLPQHWSHHQQSRYAPAQPSSLSSSTYHDDRSGVREQVMSSVRTAAGAGAASSVTSPPQAYAGGSSSRYAPPSSAYDAYDQPPRSAGGDMGAMYVPSQYQSSSSGGGGGGGYGAGAVSPAGGGGGAARGGAVVNPAGPNSFYGGGVVPLGQAGGSGPQGGGQPRNPYGSVSGQGQSIKESRRNSGMDLWPR